MRIHIVCPYQSAAMIRMTRPLEDYLPLAYEVTKSETVDPEAELNYHIPWHTLVGVEGGNHAMLYTHCNPPDTAALIDACNRARLIVCMSWQGRRELIDLGVDAAKLRVIYAAGNEFKMRRKIIGVVGYEQPNGRKRSHILLDLAWQMDLTAFHFVVCGSGWGPMAEQLKMMGVSIEAHEHLDWPEMQNVYSALDLLLVTGFAEGGPLPLLEALACGIPVLAPPVGYAVDLLDKSGIYRDETDLINKLTAFVLPTLKRQMITRLWDWKSYAEEHAAAFGRLLDGSIDLFSNSGAARYDQLLDIIDDYHPRSIVEIGTWKGDRALAMIQRAAIYHDIEEIFYDGFDLFEKQTRGQQAREFSKPGYPMETIQRRLNATGAKVKLYGGLSKDTLPKHIHPADLYFIDGGHKEETIQGDWNAVSGAMSDKSVVVFDDYYIGEHPAGIGCNAIIDYLDKSVYCVEHLPIVTTANKLSISMVKVTKNANLYLHGRDTSARSNPSYAGISAYNVPGLRASDVAKTAGVPSELEGVAA